jgi:hypothetical protein
LPAAAPPCPDRAALLAVALGALTADGLERMVEAVGMESALRVQHPRSATPRFW